MATTADTHAPRTTELKGWRDGPGKDAILAFVARVTGADGHEPVPVEDRVAVFDNDGTLWCEKPMPIQLDFILRRFAEMAATDPSLREQALERAGQDDWTVVSVKDDWVTVF